MNLKQKCKKKKNIIYGATTQNNYNNNKINEKNIHKDRI